MFIRSLMLAGIVFLSFLGVAAYSEKGSISGRITDLNGRGITGIRLELSSKLNGLELKDRTDGNGQFTFDNIDHGEYEFSAHELISGLRHKRVIDLRAVSFETEIIMDKLSACGFVISDKKLFSQEKFDEALAKALTDILPELLDAALSEVPFRLVSKIDRTVNLSTDLLRKNYRMTTEELINREAAEQNLMQPYLIILKALSKGECIYISFDYGLIEPNNGSDYWLGGVTPFYEFHSGDSGWQTTYRKAAPALSIVDYYFVDKPINDKFDTPIGTEIEKRPLPRKPLDQF